MAVKASRAPSDKSGSSPALPAGKGPVPVPGEPSPEDLLRKLAGLFGSRIASCDGSPDPGGAEEILFDVDLDGARYLLIRKPKPNRSPVQLSPREQEIVRMVAQGHPNKIIADVLNISSWTVCTHMRRIFAKLGVASRAAMVARTFTNGIPPRSERSLHLVAEAAAASMPSRPGAVPANAASQGLQRPLDQKKPQGSFSR